MNDSIQTVLAAADDPGRVVRSKDAKVKRPVLEQTEGSPLPLGVTWIGEDGQLCSSSEAGCGSTSMEEVARKNK
jgi:hypothetical protein